MTQPAHDDKPGESIQVTPELSELGAKLESVSPSLHDDIEPYLNGHMMCKRCFAKCEKGEPMRHMSGCPHDDKPNHKETHMSKSKNYRLRFGYQSESNLLLRYLNLTPDQAKDYAELLTSLFDYLETTPTYIEDEEDGLQEVDSLEAQRFLKALEKVRV